MLFIVRSKFEINRLEAAAFTLAALYVPCFLVFFIIGIIFVKRKKIFRVTFAVAFVFQTLLVLISNSHHELSEDTSHLFSFKNVIISSSSYAQYNYKLNNIDKQIIEQSNLLGENCGNREVNQKYLKCVDDFFREVRLNLVDNIFNFETFLLFYSENLFLTFGDSINMHKEPDYRMNEFKEIVARYSSAYIYKCNSGIDFNIISNLFNVNSLSVSFFERMLILFEQNHQIEEFEKISKVRFLKFLTTYIDKINYNSYSDYFLRSISTLQCSN